MVSKAWQTELRSHRISPRQWPLFGVQQEVPAWDFLRLIPRAEAARTVGGGVSGQPVADHIVPGRIS